MLFNMEFEDTKEEPDVNYARIEAESAHRKKSAEIENEDWETATVGDKLKAVPCAKGLAEALKSRAGLNGV